MVQISEISGTPEVVGANLAGAILASGTIFQLNDAKLACCSFYFVC